MDINKESIGHHLREIRISNGLTVNEMAKMLGVSYEHWRLVDRGKRLPSLDILVLVCKKFNVSLDNLFSIPEKEKNALEPPKELEPFSKIEVDDLLTSTHILKFIAANIDGKKELISPQIMGQRLNELRNKANLTLREAAKQIGIHWTYLQMLEKGKSVPSLKILKSLTEVFDVTPEYLFAYNLPNGKEILYREFIEWYQSMNEDQKKMAIKFIKGCLN